MLKIQALRTMKNQTYQDQIFTTQIIQKVPQNYLKSALQIQIQHSKFTALQLLKQTVNISLSSQLSELCPSFHNFVKSKLFRRNQQFNSEKKNLKKVILYIQNLPFNSLGLQISQSLIRQYGIMILMCFKKFYLQIDLESQIVKKSKEKLQLIASLVKYLYRPMESSQFEELNYFFVFGVDNKKFVKKLLTKQQQQFFYYHQELLQLKLFIRNQEDGKMKIFSIKQLEFIISILSKVFEQSMNPFSCFYLLTMIQEILNLHKKILVQIEQIIERADCDIFSVLNILQKLLEKCPKRQIFQNYRQINQDEKGFNIFYKNLIQYLITKIDLIMKEFVMNEQLEEDFETYIKEKQDILERQKKSETIASQINYNKKLSSISNSSQLLAINLSDIPLCCRSFFFEFEKILWTQDRTTQFKSYRIPFNPASIETLKKTISGFLNGNGGQIYLGIKQTTSKKHRYVLSNYINESMKEQTIKAVRKISENIYPQITVSNKLCLNVQFVPVRRNPFSQDTLIEQNQHYLYDFTKKKLNLQKCSYKPGRYIIRIRVPEGESKEMYSYRQTQCQLNKNTTSNQFISFRCQNEILIKEISQEVLLQYKQNLLKGKGGRIEFHKGKCQYPEIGIQAIDVEQESSKLDFKKFEERLYSKQLLNIKKKDKIQLQINENEIILQDRKSNRSSLSSSSSDQEHQDQKLFLNSRNLDEILQNPLTFVVIGEISLSKLQSILGKTPAKNYATITLFKSCLSESDILVVKIQNYANMNQFLRIKEKIEKHFEKSGVQLIGMTKKWLLPDIQARKIIESKLKKYEQHKYCINNLKIEFYCFSVAVSYFIWLKEYVKNIKIILQ